MALLRIAIILGTRPEIIKMSPIIRVLRARNLPFFILHTNQHYTKELDRHFFEELGLPSPKYNIGVGSGTHAEQTARALVGLEKVLVKERPDVVLVEGDTNTVLAGGLAAAKLGIKVGHVEAGLRSYWRGMPEELNRILTDHLSDFLFAPTREACRILKKEGIEKDKIFLTGNTIVDAVKQHLNIAEQRSDILSRLGLKAKSYFLLTAHRRENVDDKKRLRGIFRAMENVSKEFGQPVVFPMHPRTCRMVKQFGLRVPAGMKVIKPVGYLDFLCLQKNARLVFTDSGGVQEESCILGVPCVTLRDNTERPETLRIGANILAGADAEKIMFAARKMLKVVPHWKNPFGDGKAGERIVGIISRHIYE